MKRLLCIVGGMNKGGAETFLMKIYRQLNKNEYQFDFAVATEGAYDSEIRSLGGKIYNITPKSKGTVRNFEDIRDIVKKNKYEYVLRVSQNSLSALELFAAQIGGAKVRAYRSSNSNTVNGSMKEIFVHNMCKWMPSIFANVRFAPSTEAAEFMFGKNCLKKGKAFLLKNGLDLDLFKYSEQIRNEMRCELKVDGKFVVGHVGRFNQQKNHILLIEIFEKLLLKMDNAVLLLCGEGEKLDDIKSLVHKKGLEANVKFLGVRNDVPKIMCAMDVFVFPSLYEGMPNTIIEAQAVGLPCIVSDSVTKECGITDLVNFVNLNAPTEEWIEHIKVNPSRETYNSLLNDEGYNIRKVTEDFVTSIFNC